MPRKGQCKHASHVDTGWRVLLQALLRHVLTTVFDALKLLLFMVCLIAAGTEREPHGS